MRSASDIQRGFGSVLVLSTGLALGIAVGGCGKKESKPAPAPAPAPTPLAAKKPTAGSHAGAAMSSLTQTQEELNTAKANVKGVVASLQALKAATGPGAEITFKEFKTQRAAMETHAAKVAARSDDLQSRGKQYREYWQSEVSTMDNPELRAGAQERAAKVANRFDEIRAKFEACRQQYKPFQKDVADIDGYLTKELSPSSLSLSKGAIDKAITQGQTLNKTIDEAIVELVSVSVKMSSEVK